VKPTEIYALPSEHSENLYWASQELLQEVFDIEGLEWFDFDVDKDADSDLMLHRKLSMDIDSNNWVSLHTLEFKGIPFAIVNHLGTDHSGNTDDAFVTDRETYEAARAWLVAMMKKDLESGKLVDPEEDLAIRFHGARLVSVRGNVRLVPPSHVGLHEQVAIFDEQAVLDGFDAKAGGIGSDPGHGGSLTSPKGMSLAAEVIGDAVIADRKVAVGEFVDKDTWLACLFLADGEAYAARIVGKDLNTSPVAWRDKVLIERVGFAPVYDLLESYHQTGKIDLKSKAATDYAEAFGMTETEVNMALGAVAQGGGDCLEAAVAVIRERADVPEGFDYKDVWGVHARLLAETPEVVRYGLGSMPSLGHAKDAWDSYQKLQQRRMELAAAAAPAP
jgi:hypothetical protein